MRKDDFDEILRASQRLDVTPPPLTKKPPRRQAKGAIAIIALVLLGLVIVPVAFALTGDPYQLLVGSAFGDPFGF